MKCILQFRSRYSWINWWCNITDILQLFEIQLGIFFWLYHGTTHWAFQGLHRRFHTSLCKHCFIYDIFSSIYKLYKKVNPLSHVKMYLNRKISQFIWKLEYHVKHQNSIWHEFFKTGAVSFLFTMCMLSCLVAVLLASNFSLIVLA